MPRTPREDAMNLRVIAPRTAAETALAEQFAALKGGDPDGAAAFAAFATSGLPTRRNEAWHYTDLRAAMTSAAPLAPAPDAGRIEAARALLAARPKTSGARFVLLDGRYVAELSDAPPAGLQASIAPRSTVSTDLDAVVCLNGAFAAQGLHLALANGVKLAVRVEIVHCSSVGAPSAIYSRVDIALASGAEAEFVESFIGADSGVQRNALTRFALGEGSRCAHVAIIDDAPGLHLESQLADLAANSEFKAFAFVSGGALARRQLFIRQQGPGAKIALGGLSLLNGKRHADTTLVVEHAAPHGQSREFYKHIVADDATGVFQGKVIVNPGAQKTDGGMKSQAILLSPRAIMNNKPELEIFADDVVCGHGATVGALDPEQAFYLQARGLPRAEAEAMLLEAFGAEAIERFAAGDLADLLRETMRAWMAGRAAP
jgi:Fe-S cluster assembly protein SufD